jgi:tRNA(fMet)-specific endonuclease VapC
MKVLDTTFLIDVIGSLPEAVRLIDRKEPLLTTQMNMYELIRGLFLKNTSPSKVLRVMELFANVNVLPFDDQAVVKSAEINADLRKQGKLTPDNDCIIAGIALSKSINTIITRNVKHFERMKGIKVETY